MNTLSIILSQRQQNSDVHRHFDQGFQKVPYGELFMVYVSEKKLFIEIEQ